MNAYFAANRLSQNEKEDILKQHRTLYDGYRTLQSNVPNEQPLYVQDFAKDKVGAVLNNKGIAKPYTNVGINEQVEESKEMCSECGGMMSEGECTECGWKGEVGAMEEQMDDEVNWEEDDDFDQMPTPDDSIFGKEKQIEKKEKPAEFRPGVDLGKSFEKFKGMFEDTGKLSDIYNVEDLGDDEFDYVEGGGNDYGTFEKMHHMKKLKSEQDYEDPDNEDDGFEDLNTSEVDEDIALEKGKKYKYSSPSFEDELEFEDEFEDKTGGEKMFKFKGKEDDYHLMGAKNLDKFIHPMYEQGYTGGGNAPDMDISNIKPAYDFMSDGPGDVYPTEAELDEYETMESAWSEEEVDEANDISGVQGVYGDMEPAYDFDSEGPGKAGPYQRSSWGGGAKHEPDELEVDFDKFDPRDKSWEEITAHTGEDEYAHVDEDIKESLIQQKNRIIEMMNRMKVIK